MVASSDPRAAGFDSAAFKDAINFAMEMATPSDVLQRATFRWRDEKTFDTQDSGGSPYSFTAVPSITIHRDDLSVNVAVQFIPKNSIMEGTSFGEFNNPRVILTLLDESYQQVWDADEVLLGGDLYVIEYTEPPIGLFDVTVWSMYAIARDES